MRKFSKIILGTAAVLGVVGLGFTVGGVVMGASLKDVDMQYENGTVKKAVNRMVRTADDWDDDCDDDWDDDCDDDWNHDNKVASTGRATGNNEFENITALDIELTCDELILRETEEKKFTVNVDGEDIDNVRIRKEGTELKIESKSVPDNRTVIVSYPAGTEFTEISLDVQAGTATLEDDINTREFSVSVGAGTMDNTGTITAKEADIEVGIGAIELTDIDMDYLEGECGIGTISLDVAGAKTDYSYRISCDTGTILLDDEEFSGLGAYKKIDNNGAARKMQLECDMGTVEVNFEK